MPEIDSAEDVPYLSLEWLRKKNMKSDLFIFDDVPTMSTNLNEGTSLGNDTDQLQSSINLFTGTSTASALATYRDRRSGPKFAGPDNNIVVPLLENSSVANLLRSSVRPAQDLDAES